MANRPIVYVSGGGSALKDVLSGNVRNNTIFYLAPGVYDGGIVHTIGRNCSIVGEYGKTDQTIIDGHGTTFCLKSNVQNYDKYALSCHSITFKNGYCSDKNEEEIAKWAEYNISGKLIGTYFAATKNVKLYGCNVFDCEVDISPKNLAWGKKLDERTDGGVIYPGDCWNCELSGNSSPIFLHHSQSPIGSFYGCDIHHNRQTADRKWMDTYFAHNLYYSKFHHNEISNVGVGQGYDSLIYSNSGGNSYLFERGKFLNCVIANNYGFVTIDNAWGGSIEYVNDVFFNNRKIDNEYGIIACGSTLTNNLDIKIENCVFTENSLSDIFGANDTKNSFGMALYEPNRIFDLSNNTFYKDADGNNHGRNLSVIMLSDIWMGIEDPGFIDAENGDFRISSDSFIRNKSNYEDTLRKCAEYRNSKNATNFLVNAAEKNIDISFRTWAPSVSFGAYGYFEDESEKYLSLFFI